MPTAAEIALKKKYEEMLARKSKANANKLTGQAPPTKPADGTVKVTVKSRLAANSTSDKPAPVAPKQAPKQAPKVILRTNKQAATGRGVAAGKSATSTQSPPLNKSVPVIDPQAAALEAAKKALAARQAAKERQSAAQSKAPKRPTLKRPLAKPLKEEAQDKDQDSQPVKRPRLDTLLQQSTAQTQKAGAAQQQFASGDRSAGQAWSPAQQAQLPYSPGAEGNAWSPQAVYSPGAAAAVPAYSPPHPAEASGYGQGQGQGYSYTGAGQAGAGAPGHQQPHQAESTVFVGNVPDGVTDMDLADYFVDMGEVHSAQLRGNDGGHYGFVEFADPAVAQQVLSLAEQQPFMMGDQYLRVQPRRQKEQNQGGGHPAPAAHSQSEFEYAEAEHPAERQARIQAEVAAAASAAVDDMDPAELHNLAPSAQPDREIMVYDDI